MSTGRSNPTRPGSSRTRWGAGAIRLLTTLPPPRRRRLQPLHERREDEASTRRLARPKKRSHEIVGAFHDRVQTPDLGNGARTSRVG